MVSNGIRKPVFIELKLHVENIPGDDVNGSQRFLESCIKAILQRFLRMDLKRSDAIRCSL